MRYHEKVRPGLGAGGRPFLMWLVKPMWRCVNR
jgi:hypothetical protein